MDLTFERGDPQRPKGHALVYFRVKADLAKYVPPFLATHLGNLPLNDFSAFAMPPMPEPVDSYQELERLCRLRDDDLVYVTSMFSFDLPRMMEAVTEAVQSYSQLCGDFFNQASAGEREALETGGEGANEGVSYQVNEVLFSLMSENDKLTELSRLLGKLRFAQEGRDTVVMREVTEEI